MLGLLNQTGLASGIFPDCFATNLLESLLANITEYVVIIQYWQYFSWGAAGSGSSRCLMEVGGERQGVVD